MTLKKVVSPTKYIQFGVSKGVHLQRDGIDTGRVCQNGATLSSNILNYKEHFDTYTLNLGNLKRREQTGENKPR